MRPPETVSTGMAEWDIQWSPLHGIASWKDDGVASFWGGPHEATLWKRSLEWLLL